MVVFNPVVVSGDDPQRLGQIGFAAVRRSEDAKIHARCDTIQR